jgi:Fe-S cluster assembly protein SufD
MSVKISPNIIPTREELGAKTDVTPQDTYLMGLIEQSQALALPEVAPQVASLRQELRDRASLWLKQISLPGRRDEEWRFTNLSPLTEVNFQTPQVTSDIVKDAIASLTLPEATIRLTFVNGIYTSQLSAVEGLPEGVYVGNLAALPAEYANRLGDYLGRQMGSSETFTALNTASLADAAVVWVSKSQIVETPIHLLFLSTTGDVPAIAQPRCLVVAEANSQLTLVEHYAAEVEGCPDLPVNRPYFTNQVTEIWLEENAQVNHTRNQRDAGDAFHIGKTAVAQARDSRYTCNAITLGAKLSRHNLEVYQKGEGTQTYLNGLTAIAGEQVADTHSAIALNHPNGTSDQLHKCIADDRSHIIFNGKIFVPQAAQLTNASQLNRNLMLSPKARVNTKPQLEITADNVKCAHGATISQLEAEAVFYLQSRGLSETDARNLLIDAFVAEILDRIPVESLRQRLLQCTACRTI